MYTPQQVTSGALTAALRTVARLEEDPTMEFVTTEDLIRMSELEPPNEDDLATVHKQWGFNLMSLREQWRHMVLERAGRWPESRTRQNRVAACRRARTGGPADDPAGARPQRRTSTLPSNDKKSTASCVSAR